MLRLCVCLYNVVLAQVWSTLCNQKQNTVACIAQKLINPHARPPSDNRRGCINEKWINAQKVVGRVKLTQRKYLKGCQAYAEWNGRD